MLVLNLSHISEWGPVRLVVEEKWCNSFQKQFRCSNWLVALLMSTKHVSCSSISSWIMNYQTWSIPHEIDWMLVFLLITIMSFCGMGVLRICLTCNWLFVLLKSNSSGHGPSLSLLDMVFKLDKSRYEEGMRYVSVVSTRSPHSYCHPACNVVVYRAVIY